MYEWYYVAGAFVAGILIGTFVFGRKTYMKKGREWNPEATAGRFQVAYILKDEDEDPDNDEIYGVPLSTNGDDQWKVNSTFYGDRTPYLLPPMGKKDGKRYHNPKPGAIVQVVQLNHDDDSTIATTPVN